MKDIKSALTCWGNWAGCRIGIEYPTQAYGLLGTKEGTQSAPICSDDEGMLIDAAVSSLKTFDIDAHAVIEAFYLRKMSFSQIGRIVRKPTNYITAYASRAEYYLAGKLGYERKMDAA